MILAAPILFGGAPTDTNLAQIAAILIEIVLVLAFLYNIVGLSLPPAWRSGTLRDLRDCARKSLINGFDCFGASDESDLMRAR